MTVDLAPDALPALTALAEAEVHRHKPRTPPRRAAAALWAALSTTDSPGAAQRALDGFTAPAVAGDATALLHRLAARLAATEGK